MRLYSKNVSRDVLMSPATIIYTHHIFSLLFSLLNQVAYSYLTSHLNTANFSESLDTPLHRASELDKFGFKATARRLGCFPQNNDDQPCLRTDRFERAS